MVRGIITSGFRRRLCQKVDMLRRICSQEPHAGARSLEGIISSRERDYSDPISGPLTMRSLALVSTISHVHLDCAQRIRVVAASKHPATSKHLQAHNRTRHLPGTTSACYKYLEVLDQPAMPASFPASPTASPSSSRRSKPVGSPAYRADRLSYSSSSGSGKPSSSHYQQPPATVRYLEQLSFSMISGRPTPKAKDVRYVLLVTQKRNELPWTVSRSFRDYRALQKRLLTVLQQGHFCNAECPWMYSFVKSQFPKECHVLSGSKYVVRKRVESLSRCLSTLHAHLLNRANHCCSVVTSAVAMELIEFINADLDTGSEASWSYFVQDVKDFSSSSSSSSAELDSLPKLDISIRLATNLSSTTATSSARSTSSRSQSSDCSACSLCSPSNQNQHSEDVWNDGCVSPTPDIRASASMVTLSCGHQFHDECIVPRLNEALQCPTCGHAQAFC